jgi:cbb3-type cytochrome oxidase subunit 1
MHFTTNSKKLSSHQLKGKIHLITVHIIRIKPFIDTVKKSSKKNIYYVSYFMGSYLLADEMITF